MFVAHRYNFLNSKNTNLTKRTYNKLLGFLNRIVLLTKQINIGQLILCTLLYLDTKHTEH
jgi:hypothetical protein